MRQPVAIFATVVLIAFVASATLVVSVEGRQPADEANRLVVAVVGDGYAKADQALFRQDVERYVTAGALRHPGFASHQKSFSIKRIDAVSVDSGISKIGSPKNTALGITFTGGSCYIEEGPYTVPRLNTLLASLPKYDYVMVLLNTDEYGGCAVGLERLYLTRVGRVDVAVHELAHGVAKLYDEYARYPETFPGGEVNDLNCSTVLDRSKVTWNSLLSPNAALPSDGSTAAVGMYTGCNDYALGIFRPADRCVMRVLGEPFCPVCSNIIRYELSKYSTQAAPPLVSAQSGRYVDMVVEVSRAGKFAIVDAREKSGIIDLASSQSGEYLIAVQREGRPLSVTAVPARAFQRRGYGPPGQESAPHSTIDSPTAMVRVRVPGMTLNELATAGLDLTMFRVERGRLQALQTLPAKISPNALQQLKDSALITMEWSVNPAALQQALTQFQIRK